MKIVSFDRKWILCPHCGAKHSLYDNTAECRGVYAKCTRGCKKEFEIVIAKGEQVFETENDKIRGQSV